jgi:hypothetical protein
MSAKMGPRRVHRRHGFVPLCHRCSGPGAVPRATDAGLRSPREQVVTIHHREPLQTGTETGPAWDRYEGTAVDGPLACARTASITVSELAFARHPDAPVPPAPGGDIGPDCLDCRTLERFPRIDLNARSNVPIVSVGPVPSDSPPRAPPAPSFRSPPSLPDQGNPLVFLLGAHPWIGPKSSSSKPSRSTGSS